MPTRTCSGDPAAVFSFGTAATSARPALHRALGVVLMGLRIAEIGEHAVAHVFGDEAAVALRSTSAQHVVIGRDDLSHVLGVEPRRQRGRADEVAEHHRELAALGRVGGCRTGRRCRWSRIGMHSGQTCNRLEQSLAMAQ